MTRAAAPQRRMCRSAVAACALASLVSLPGAAADLAVGSFFGANWKAVENEVRTEFRKSLAMVRQHCASEATCPSLEVRKFCGYEDDLYYRLDLNFASAMTSHSDGRHLFDVKCDLPHLGTGCFFPICFEDCFRDKTSPVSRECQKALDAAEWTHDILQEVEDMHDDREQYFIVAISIIALLSMVAGALVVLLDRETKASRACDGAEDNDRSAHCARGCVIINWISVFILLGFVITMCPRFLIVIVPPFLLVHGVYHGCCHASRRDVVENVRALECSTLAIPLIKSKEEKCLQVAYSALPVTDAV